MADQKHTSKKRGGYKSELYNSPLYRSWYNMKTRCLNKNTAEYTRYGLRGISICEKWLDFKGFLEDMGISYKKGYSIDRIDNNGNYCKENCQWADKKQQANNRRTSRILEFKGDKKTLAQWSDLIGIKRTTISQRIDYYGWSVEKALSILI